MARFGGAEEPTCDRAELDHLDGQPETDQEDETEAGLQEEPEPEDEEEEDAVDTSSDDDETGSSGDDGDAGMGGQARNNPATASAPEPATAPEPEHKRRRMRGKQPRPPGYQNALPATPAAEPPMPPPNEPPSPPMPDAADDPGQANPRKRPAARQIRPNELCQGCNGTPCCFSTRQAGQPAYAQPQRGEWQCLLCCPEKLLQASQMTRANRLTITLKVLLARGPAIFDQAITRIKLVLGDAVAEDFATRAQRAAARAAQPARQDADGNPDADAAANAPAQRGGAGRQDQQDWSTLLAHRQPAGKDLKESERAKYEQAEQRDQRAARRKIFFPDGLRKWASEAQEAEEKAVVQAAGSVEDVAPNDVGLPSPADAHGRMVEAWCKQGSWAMCEKCHSMCPRPLQPIDLRRLAKGTIPASQCTACKHGEDVPQPEDIPQPLRKLKPKVIEALRPLQIMTGPYERASNGYRVHTGIFSTMWKEEAVEEQIKGLRKRRDRRAARAAFNHLMDDENSAYADFINKHDKFLAKHGTNAAEKRRRRPLRFMEEEGLECCLWPHLYWHRNLCETVARASHEARRRRRRNRFAVDSTDEEEEEQEEDEEQEAEEEEEAEDTAPKIETSTQGRIKRGFVRKLLSPVLGYGADFELLQFVYDLSLWATVGAKKNISTSSGISLRALLKGSPWTPQYWRIRHQAVIDMQRQCGNASLFRTRAPYERTFPYHRWVLDEQAKLGKERLHLPVAETLHMAHVLMQLDAGYICGDKATTGRQDRTWSNHVLGPADGSNINTVKAHVTRLEFQDGKRKRATQKYHGRGTVHSLSLDFLENMPAIGLETKLQATVPPKDTEPFMHGLVIDSQCDYKDSKLPIREEQSVWDAENGKVLLHHKEEDKDAHVRAFLKPTMAITKCHEDVQQGDGNGAVLRYTATYNTKFSSSMDTEWLGGDASDYSTAAGLLRRHKPLEPEIVLTLAQERFPQINLTGTILDIMAPSIDDVEGKKDFVRRYEEAMWRREDMPLLEFLRKSNAKGEIIHHIQKKHQVHAMGQVREQVPEEDDRTFARRWKAMLSHYNQLKKHQKANEEQVTPLAEFLGREGFDNITSVEEFANNYECRGEKLVAATTYSMLNDKYYGQWLALHKPFRALEDFKQQAPELVERVPAKYLNFALCLHHAPEFWLNDMAIKSSMELEAHSAAHIETILSKVKAQTHIAWLYMAGEKQQQQQQRQRQQRQRQQ